MEETTQVTPGQIEGHLQDLVPLNVIRTETVLSRLPIHNLAKKGTVNIHIMKKDAGGKVDFQWQVSPSRDYGEPRQLAYKLDTLVINRRIEKQGRPLAKIIRLGSLRELAQELDLGGDTQAVRKALMQNASAFITAKLSYKATDGGIRRLETGFARYSVAFTGEELPDGKRADAVFLILNEPYLEVLNNAPVRPLDYDYLRQLPPAAQRFYEILSRQVFAAFKFKHATASIAYSEYCTYSAQRRYFERPPVQSQMNAIHQEHKKSGYITSVRYQATVDAENNPDWIMYYEPGPKAKAEYDSFTRPGRKGSPSRPPRVLSAGEPLEPAFAELTRRGVSVSKATFLLARADHQRIFDQLEWGDHLIQHAPAGTYRNPPGFYAHLISEGIIPPDRFETSRKRKRREEAYAAQIEEQTTRLELEDAYRDYRAAEVDQHIASQMRPEDFKAMVRDRERNLTKGAGLRNLPPTTIREISDRDVRAEIAGRIPTLLTLEKFSEEWRTKAAPAVKVSAISPGIPD